MSTDVAVVLTGSPVKEAMLREQFRDGREFESEGSWDTVSTRSQSFQEEEDCYIFNDIVSCPGQPVTPLVGIGMIDDGACVHLSQQDGKTLPDVGGVCSGAVRGQLPNYDSVVDDARRGGERKYLSIDPLQGGEREKLFAKSEKASNCRNGALVPGQRLQLCQSQEIDEREAWSAMKERMDRSDKHQMMFADSVNSLGATLQTVTSSMGKMMQMMRELELRGATTPGRCISNPSPAPMYIHQSTKGTYECHEPLHYLGSQVQDTGGTTHKEEQSGKAARGEMHEDIVDQACAGGEGGLPLYAIDSLLLKRFGWANALASCPPAMIGSSAASEKITLFFDEKKGVLLRDWVWNVMIKKSNHRWSDEQTARLIVECCRGRARWALDLLTASGRTQLVMVLRTLEKEFYSNAKQVSAKVSFNNRKRLPGESEREFAESLVLLVDYAFRDDDQAYINSRCREQFLLGLRCRDLTAYLTLFCKDNLQMDDLVKSAEEYRACMMSNILESDDENPSTAVTNDQTQFDDSSVQSQVTREKRSQRSRKSKWRGRKERQC